VYELLVQLSEGSSAFLMGAAQEMPVVLLFALARGT